MTLSPGDPLPPFSATRDDGRPYESAPDRWRVLFFFPKTATTHCQLQARRYQQLEGEFRTLGVDVVGVNGDPKREQQRFRDICKLDYPLLEDSRHTLINLFGIPTATWPGEEVARPRRDTFLIDPQGRVAHHWADVDPATDAQTVLETVKGLQG